MEYVEYVFAHDLVWVRKHSFDNGIITFTHGQYSSKHISAGERTLKTIKIHNNILNIIFNQYRTNRKQVFWYFMSLEGIVFFCRSGSHCINNNSSATSYARFLMANFIPVFWNLALTIISGFSNHEGMLISNSTGAL